ncbi:MAG TPA: ABC transporter ATP-binding protein [Phycisphaerales bacterium]|nr:ABC transporter ATP-binding protein [Phycisphaerales bacterium]
MTLVIDQLSHRYGAIHALQGISVRAEPGRITAVLGPNASGKSTLLRCIIGAIAPTSGCVTIDNQPVHKLHPYWLAQRVAYVPQRSVVSAAFTVREVVELGRYALPPSRARIDEALEKLELVELADRPYPNLSVGQQQRVALARAMAQLGRGDVAVVTRRGKAMPATAHLILDEPTSAMDLKHVHQAMSVLREAANGGATVLIAMHDLALAAAIADEAWLLHEGRLFASGSVCEVLNVETLHEVYGVSFEWTRGPGGKPALLSAPPEPARRP